MAEPDDAALVASALAGDSNAFAAIYDRYADRIHDYAYSVVRQASDAADITQDTFLAASQRFDQLRDPTKLRPWLYAIARSFAFKIIRNRRRTEVSDEVDEVVEMSGSEGALDATELVWAAAAGLEPGDRDILDLHLRQGLDGQELADALGVTSNAANVALHRVRERMEQSVGAVLLARTSQGECADLDALIADGLTPLVRKRVARHVGTCEVCSDRRSATTSAAALFSATGVVTAPLALRTAVLQSAGTDAAVSASRRLDWNADGFPVTESLGPVPAGAGRAASGGSSVNPLTIAASVVALVVGLAAVFVFVRQGGDDELVSSAADIETAATARATTSSLGSLASPAPQSTVSPTPVVATAPPPASTTAPTPTSPPSTATTPNTTTAPSTTPAPSTTASPPGEAPVLTVDAPQATVVVLGTPPTIDVVDYICQAEMTVVVDLAGSGTLSAELRFEEVPDEVDFMPDPVVADRFTVVYPLDGESFVTPRVVASSPAGSRSEVLDPCILID